MIKEIWHRITNYRSSHPERSMGQVSRDLGVSKSMVKRQAKRQKGRNQYSESEVWESVAGQLFLKRLIVSSIYTFGIKEVLIVHLSILITFSIIAFFVFFVQHQHDNSYKEFNKNWEYLLSAIKGSTFFKLPKILQWFTGNIGFHHIHHLSPKIPSYWLEKCNNDNPVFEKFVTKINLRTSTKMLSNYLWSEVDKKMITFKEYKEKYC